MEIKKYFQQEHLGKTVRVLAILVLALVIFQAGVFVGYKKAEFRNHWDSTISRDMDNPIFAPFSPNKNDRNPHGAIGQVVSIKLPSMLIKGPNTADEVMVITDNDTIIRKFHDQASTSDLEMGDHVIVIGNPDNNGAIHATFIRMVPPQPNK